MTHSVLHINHPVGQSLNPKLTGYVCVCVCVSPHVRVTAAPLDPAGPGRKHWRVGARKCWVPQIGPDLTGGETACQSGRTAIPKHSGAGLIGQISLSGLGVLLLGGHRDGGVLPMAAGGSGLHLVVGV